MNHPRKAPPITVAAAWENVHARAELVRDWADVMRSLAGVIAGGKGHQAQARQLQQMADELTGIAGEIQEHVAHARFVARGGAA